MADILQDFPVKASRTKVFEAFSTCRGLDAWWTLDSAGVAEVGSEFALNFGPEYQWRAEVTRFVPGEEIEYTFHVADHDWRSSRVGCRLSQNGDATTVHFYHRGWPEANEHYRISSHCWALYLRLLRRYLECGEIVPYAERLNA